MSGTDAGDTTRSPADAELADAMNSIEAIGEDWRSRERGTDDAEDDPDERGADASEEKEDNHG